MKYTVDILIPTWNNAEYLCPCVDSIVKTGALGSLARLIIINNGKQPIKEFVGGHPDILVIEAPENLGWEGGLKLGLKYSDAKYVVFQNDDTHIPPASTTTNFYQNLILPFGNGNVAAVGPVTTCAAGPQSIYHPQCPRGVTETTFLIGFCLAVRRDLLDAAGGIDDTLRGGDDFDLSIRLRKLGKQIVVNPYAFLVHHGFKTGTRVRGDHTTKGGWNSVEMQENTNHDLIVKHGLKTFVKAMYGIDYDNKEASLSFELNDLEGEFVRQHVEGESVLELGCGGLKTVPHAVGVDRFKGGEKIPIIGRISVADVQADVQEPLPFPDKSQDTVIARHILEHCLDTVETLKNWSRVLKVGGKLIVAVPDEDVTVGIPLNPEHVHAFNKKSLENILSLCGFKGISFSPATNNMSLVACFEKVFDFAPQREEALV